MASTKATALAEATDQRIQRTVNKATKLTANGIGRQALSAAFKAFEQGSNPVGAAMVVLNRMLTARLVAGSVNLHLEGRAAIFERSESKAPRNFAVTDDAVFGAANRSLIARSRINSIQLDELEAQWGNPAIRSTDGVNQHLENVINREMRIAIQQGPLTTAEGKKVIGRAFEKAGVTGTKPYIFETIYRTQLQQAFAAGRWNAIRDPAVQDILWGFEYVTVGDDRVRPEHAILDGMRLPKEDPRWNTLWPPNGFNCRCSTIEIFKDDPTLAKEKGPDTTKKDEQGNAILPIPDVGFDFNAGQVSRDIINRALEISVDIETLFETPI